MQGFYLVSVFIIALATGAFASEVTDTFQTNFIDRFLISFREGKEFDLEGLRCDEDGQAASKTCENAQSNVLIQIKAVDRQNGAKTERWTGAGYAVMAPGPNPLPNWMVRDKGDLDAIFDLLEAWVKSTPDASDAADCAPTPGEGILRSLTVYIPGPSGEKGYLLARFSAAGDMFVLVFAFMQGEGYCY